MQCAQDHDTANVLQAHQRLQPVGRAGFEKGESALDRPGQIAKFVPCQMHQFADRPVCHDFLHRLTAPIAAFAGGPCDGGGGCTARRPQRSGGVPRHLHRQPTNGAKRPEEGRRARSCDGKRRASWSGASACADRALRAAHAEPGGLGPSGNNPFCNPICDVKPL